MTEQDKVAEIVDLLAAADGDAGAIADLDGCVDRLHRSRQASALRRSTLDGQPR